MKVANQNQRHDGAKNDVGSFMRAPIGLKRPKELFSFIKENTYLEMKLCSSPTDDSSPTYSLKMPIFKTGSAEQWFHWRAQFKVVLRGQNLTTGSDQFAMARRLLTGEALTRFNNEASNERLETPARLERCLQAVTDYILPKYALAHQKRYLRRLCRKPATLTIKQYYARYKEVNEYLALFNEEGAANRLDEDEVKEHLYYSIPNRWQKEMIMHGFEPIERPIDEFLEFCERLEVTEGIYNTVHKKPAGMPENGSTPSSRKRASSSSTANDNARRFFCMYHGQNSTHNTDQCKVLKPQIERLKSSHESARTNIYNRKLNAKKATEQGGPNNPNNRFHGYAENAPNRAGKRQKTLPNIEELDSFNYEKFRTLKVDDSDEESE
jgi:hypothetical protein